MTAFSRITLTSHERYGVSNQRNFGCLFNSLFKQAKIKLKWSAWSALYEENPPTTSGFSSQSASDIEIASIPWHHHGKIKNDPVWKPIHLTPYLRVAISNLKTKMRNCFGLLICEKGRADQSLVTFNIFFIPTWQTSLYDPANGFIVETLYSEQRH